VPPSRLLSRTQEAPGAPVTPSFSAAFPSASATGVNDHVNCCHSSRAAECCSRRSMPRQGFSLDVSLSLGLSAREQASERGRQAGSRRVSTPTIWLKNFQPPPPPKHTHTHTYTPRASLFLHTRSCPLTAPANRKTATLNHSLLCLSIGKGVDYVIGRKTVLTVTCPEC